MSLLELKDLTIHFFTDEGVVKAVNSLSLHVGEGETLGLVGETGAGKTTTALGIMTPDPPGKIVSGQIIYNGEDLVRKSQIEMRDIRGRQISMIFQDPMTALNPVLTVGDQIAEVIRLHEEISRADAYLKAAEMLEMVGIANSQGVYEMYPHELSGGMRQRVMIAMALACNPKVIIADEPTTALDVTIQAQILDLLRSLKDRINSSIMLITHDLGVIAEMADYVVVMYAGRVVEKGTAQEIFANPAHPYTIGLMASKPIVGKKVDRLYSIPGKVPNPVNMPNYCYFKDRCEMALPCCDGEYPCEISLSPTHKVSCYRYYEENRKAGE